MARTEFTPEDLREVRELAAGWGKIVARRAFGDKGPGLDVDLSALEQLALEAARGLTEGALTTLLEQQARALGEQQACPACGRLCPVGRESRPLHVCGGQEIAFPEPVCHCPACRRDFFPPAGRVAPRQPRLQPGAAPPDR